MVDASGVAVNIGYKVGSVYVCLNFRCSNAFPVVFRRTVSYKGLEIQSLVGSAVAGFNHAGTITKASA